VEQAVDEQMGAAVGDEGPPKATPGPSSGKGPLSMVGIAFAVLAVVCVIGLLLVLNYDTWIAGEDESNIGDTQMMYVYLAVAAVVVCVALVAFDFVRNRGATAA
jgi:hypothetical protein